MGICVFVRSGTNWTQQAMLPGYFGKGVSISGDYIVAGDWTEDIGNNVSQGAVYIFKRSGTVWHQEVRITAMDGVGDDNFGVSVSIEGDYVVVGAFRDDIGGYENQGSAYIYKRNEGGNWTFQNKLIQSYNDDDNQYFGNKVSISNGYVLIGAYQTDLDSQTQGAAYIFSME